MSSIFGLVSRVSTTLFPPAAGPAPGSSVIKFGILGAAGVAQFSLLCPARTHPEAMVYAVAARDMDKAEAYAKKHGIGKAYGGSDGYQDMLDDPEADAVYNALPNGLHYEWSMKALAAGKHVLVEKPSTNTAEESSQLFEFAERQGLVLLEALHYRFHPAVQRVKAILDSGELGKITDMDTSMTLFQGGISNDGIRFDHSLGGGALMDMGCYNLHLMRYLTSSNPISVTSATPFAFSEQIDRGMTATLAFPSDVTAKLTCDMAQPHKFGIIPRLPTVSAVIKCERGEISIGNFFLPTFYHSITITAGSVVRVEKAYTFQEAGLGDYNGEVWWTTYRYQFEAFINKVKGRRPQTWIDRVDSVDNMRWIEAIYTKAGMKSRPKSSYVRLTQL